MRKLSVSVVALALTSMLSSASFAANTGTINFSGTLTATTCNTNVNNSGSNTATVKLPTLSTADLDGTTKQTAGLTTFYLTPAGCSCPSTLARAYFEPGNNVNAEGRLINNTASGAQNVELQLLDAGNNYAVIKAGDPIQMTSKYIFYY